MIYSIGYSKLSPAKLARTVAALNAILVDVRSSTRSRISGFGGRQLEALLPEGRYKHEPALGGNQPKIVSARSRPVQYGDDQGQGERAPG